MKNESDKTASKNIDDLKNQETNTEKVQGGGIGARKKLKWTDAWAKRIKD